MTRRGRLAILCGTLLATPPAGVLARAHAAQAVPASAAASAVQASPDLVKALSQELAATPEQSAGAAGALFRVAKSRLKPEEFAQVAKAVPGMPALLKAAPTGSKPGSLNAVSKAAHVGSSNGLASAVSAFTTLGLKPELVPKAIPVLTSFVTKSGGANVGNLLAGVLK